jgi:hypothetical protein
VSQREGETSAQPAVRRAVRGLLMTDDWELRTHD